MRKKNDDEDKIGEAIDRIQRFFHFLKQFIFRLFHRSQSDQSSTPAVLTNDLSTVHDDIEMQPMNDNSITSPACQSLHMPPDCCPKMISKHFSCCTKYIPKVIQEQWTYLRSLGHRPC